MPSHFAPRSKETLAASQADASSCRTALAAAQEQLIMHRAQAEELKRSLAEVRFEIR